MIDLNPLMLLLYYYTDLCPTFEIQANRFLTFLACNNYNNVKKENRQDWYVTSINVNDVVDMVRLVVCFSYLIIYKLNF